MKVVDISKQCSIGAKQNLVVIAGPCQIESLEHCLMISERLLEIQEKLPLQFIFKSSFDKANRTSLDSARGLGIDKGLRILEEVRRQSKLPVITDIHLPEQAKIAASVVDVIQIPAFLCRQTDLLLAAGATGKPINVKKGQFMHASDMQHVANKIEPTGNKNILLCERGTCFGYRDLVVDMRNLVIMKELRYPIVFDASHSVANMGGANGRSGGRREFIEPLVKAAVAVGVDALFIECHEQPERAPSDADCMLALDDLEGILDKACKIHALRVDE